MSLDLDRIPRWAPGPQARVDWSHPLAAGLIMFVGGAGVDHATGRTVTRNTHVTDGTSAWGKALTVDRTNNGYISLPSSDAGWLGPISIMWVGRINTVADYINLVTKGTGSAAGADGPLDVYLRSSGSIVMVHGPVTSSDNGTIAAGQNHIVVTHDLTTAVAYVNGVRTSIVYVAAPNGANHNVHIGRRPDGATQLAGSVSACAAWSRVLNAGEVAALRSDPFCMLRED